MSLSPRDQQVLNRIEEAIADSEPGLVCLLATFGRLTAGEEMPAREQIAAGRPRTSRRRPRPGKSHPAGWPGGRLGWSMTWSLLWLAASIALAVAVVALGHGESSGGCRAGGIACGWQAPGHGVRPAVPGTPAGQTVGTSG